MRNPVLRRFFTRFLMPQWPAVLAIVVLIVVFALSGGAFAYLTGTAIGVVIERGSALGLGLIVAGILGLAVLRGVVGFFQTLIAGQAGLRLSRDVNLALIEQVLAFPTDRFRRDGTGAWVERIRGDTTLLTTVTAQLALLGAEGLSALVYLSVAAWQSWFLLVLGGVAILGVSAVLTWINRRINVASHKARQQSETATRHLTDVLEGQQTVRAQGAEGFEVHRWDQQVQNLNLRLRSQVVSLATFKPVMEASVGIAFALVVGIGGVLVLEGRLELAAVFSFLIAFILGGQSFQRTQKIIANAQPLIASAQRVMALLDESKTVWSKAQLDTLSIEAKALTVRFEEGGIEDVNLRFEGPGLFALVGPSGSGKSTLLKALAGLVTPDAGQVQIGTIDPAHFSPDTRRACLGYLAQDARVFEGSVAFNVAYGDASPEPERVGQALEDVQARHLLDEPEATLLSGGEQQRVLLARALYQRTSVLLLDEATSALDALLEDHVTSLLETLGQTRTVVLISHHLRTVQRADTIAFLDAGKVVEQGSHDQLLAQNGAYARLWKAQA